MQNILEVRDLGRSYVNFRLEHISFSIAGGTIMGLVGENGAGKSTAIRLMLGLAKADGGIIELFGKPITEIMAEDRQNIGVSLAESGFNGQFTIVEVEKILAKMYPKFEESWFTRECQKLHLPEGKQFKEFSNGMKAKLRVLTALSHKAQLLILDEPTSNMDNASEQMIKNRLKAVMGNKTLVLITHRLSMLELVDRLIVMEGGRIIADGPKNEVLRRLREQPAPRTEQ